MSLIDASFFVGDINIVNTDEAAVLERLTFFIVKFEKECLKNLLGNALYASYLADPDTERMVRLISGDIEEGGDWVGLVHDMNLSLIAYYIYYQYQESAATLTTGVSTATANTEGGVSVSPEDKMINAWNMFCEEAQQCVCFLKSNRSDYPESTVNTRYVADTWARDNTTFAF